MLPDQRLLMPPEWRELLEELAPVFARRSTHRLFTVLACGLILADRGTVTGMAAAAGAGRQWRRACWFFAAAKWDPDALGLAVARLIVKYLLSGDDPLIAAVDCTFFRRWGRRVFQARWAYDGAAQGGKKIAFGNTWAVLAIVVRLPCCPSPVALPVLFRLWRGKGTASQVELAAELLKTLADAFPGREVHGTGDAAFHGKPLVIEGTTWTTRLPSSAVLHELKPPPTGRRGRPREKGDRIGTCADAAGTADWRDVTVPAYGKETKMQVSVRPALWHGSFGSPPGQLVLARDPDSGRAYDLGIFTLDTDLTAEQAVERYSWRWAIEPSNAAGKQVTGAGDAFMSGFLSGWLRDQPLDERRRDGDLRVGRRRREARTVPHYQERNRQRLPDDPRAGAVLSRRPRRSCRVEQARRRLIALRLTVSDVARTEHLTFIAAATKDDVGPTNNWMDPDGAKHKVGVLLPRSSKAGPSIPRRPAGSSRRSPGTFTAGSTRRAITAIRITMATGTATAA